jgi:hypothetical protein
MGAELGRETVEMVSAMPTVLEVLREHLLGDEVADKLEQWLAASTAVLQAKAAVAEQCKPILRSPSDAQIEVEESQRKIPILEALRTPSPGYELLLMAGGWNQLVARGMAKLAKRHGGRVAAESQWERRVFDAIRFLARRPRQHRAILRRAKLLLEAYEKTSLIESLFAKAKLNELEFVHLLKMAIAGNDIDRQHLTDIAAAVDPFVAIRRGPKITAASAAHEFLFREALRLHLKRRPYMGRSRAAPYTDPRTEATRLEFGLATFDSRSARRRVKPRHKHKTGHVIELARR